jgi:hypothetical protein
MVGLHNLPGRMPRITTLSIHRVLLLVNKKARAVPWLGMLWLLYLLQAGSSWVEVIIGMPRLNSRLEWVMPAGEYDRTDHVPERSVHANEML